MTTATLERRETLIRRVRELPDEGIRMVARYVEEIEEHEPNEDTIAAMLEADELARQYSRRILGRVPGAAGVLQSGRDR